MSNEQDIRELYQRLLDCWNRQDAKGFAALFLEDGQSIGFDGSRHNNPVEMEATLANIFAHHRTASFLGIIRDVRWLSPQIAILSAVAGMVPPGQSDINPAVNAVQSLVAQSTPTGWRIALFHNTPAAYHGRPELAEQLSQELRAAIQRL